MATKPISVTEQWIPAFTAYANFAESNRIVGLSPSLAAFRRFLDKHSDRLEAAGVLAKANGKHWLAHRDTFADAAFLAAIGKLDVAA